MEKWVTLYQTFGEDAFHHTRNANYSEEIKQKAVRKYLTTDVSQQDICREYKLRSISQVQLWVKDAKKQKSSKPDRQV